MTVQQTETTTRQDGDWPAGLPHHGAQAHHSYADEVACADDRDKMTYHCTSCGNCVTGQEARRWDYDEMVCDPCWRWLSTERKAGQGA